MPVSAPVPGCEGLVQVSSDSVDKVDSSFPCFHFRTFHKTAIIIETRSSN